MKGGKMMKEMNKEHMGMHMKHKGALMFTLGALILLNVYVAKFSWIVFAGGILVLAGSAKMMHSGKCCKRGK
jgi:uncharacterized membrane protein HdeD (DUF308 family)